MKLSVRLDTLIILFHAIIGINGIQNQLPANNEQPFASIVYTAVVKGKMALPCDVTPPSPDDSVALILWYKDDALAPIYTLDARKGNVDQARTLVAPILEGRASFNLHNRPAFLQIDPITLSDSGDYRCRVDFKKARTVNTVISLKVVVPPEAPRITNLNGEELRGLVGPYNEGDEFKLVCTTNGGKPRPSLTWWRDYAVIDDSFEYNDRDGMPFTTNQLRIPSLARHHLLSVFMCQAINNNITVPSQTSVTLDMNLKPTNVHISQLTPIIVAGKEATFECSTFGSRPKAILYWLFDGKRFNTTLNSDSQTSTTITVSPRRDHNGDHITCVAENPRIRNSVVSKKIGLDIQYIPKLDLQLGSPTISLQTLQEGNDIYFDCHIDANPRPTRPLIWRFNGDLLHSQPGVIQSNQTLVLQRVSKTQSGSYQCEAGNLQGTALSNIINLKIRYAPVCKLDFVLVYDVTLHETIQLDCDVDANPAQVSFQWKHQSNADLISFNQVNDTSSVLNYTPRGAQDYGRIVCVAKNDVGLQQKPCAYHIVSGGPPQFPFNCQVANQSDNALVIHCIYNIHVNISGDGNRQTSVFVYPRTLFVCEVYHINGHSLIANVSASLPVPTSGSFFDVNNNNVQFEVASLRAATHYKLRIYAQNTKGRSKDISLNAQTLKPAERLIDSNADGNNDTLLNYSHNGLLRGKPLLIALLIGVTIVAIIVMVIGFIAVLRVRRGTSTQTCPPSAVSEDQPQDATVYSEDDCCCVDECCDEMLLSSTNVTHSQLQCGTPSKGPPDIIPSFGYSSSAMDSKQTPNYDSQRQQNDEESLQYAELAFSGPNNSKSNNKPGGQHHQNQHHQRESVEYAKIEFSSKTPRVNVIGGSPKFESTV